MNNRKIFLRLFGYMKKIKGSLIIGFVWLACTTAIQLYAPTIIEKILDEQFTIRGILNLKTFTKLLIFYALLMMTGALLRYLTMISFKKSANLAAVHIRKDVFSHIQKLPISYFVRQNAGKIVTRITNDTDGVKALFQTVLSQFVTSFLFILSAIVILAIRQPWAVIFCILPLPLFLWSISYYHKKSQVLNRKYRRLISQANSDIHENIQGMELIRSYQVEDQVQKEFEELNQEILETGLKLEKLDALMSYNFIGTARMISVALLLFAFGYLHLKGYQGATVGFLFVVLDYTSRIYNAAQQIMNRLTEFERSISSAEHIFEVLDENEEMNTGQNRKEIQGKVEYDKVSFSYVDGIEVLKNISIQADPGETIALVGDTGSGKSSIIHLIFGFYEVDTGEIRIDEVPLRKYSKKELRRQMAIVLQDPFIFRGSIYENITLFENYSEEEVLEALISVGGKEILRHLEKGIHTPLKEGGSTLSLGERQMITFARAMLRDPKILVLDEATASVDSETEKYIQEGMDRLKKGRTTFIIAHRLSTIEQADRIYVLEQGKVVEWGTHEELRKKKGKYYHMTQKEGEDSNK